MKKLFAIALAIAMIATLSVTAFAAIDAETGTGSASIAVNGTITGETRPDAYYVTLTATDLTFNYVGAVYEWDPDALEYVVADGGDAHWAAEEQTFDIINKSSKGIVAQVSASATSQTATLQVKAGEGEYANSVNVSLDAPADGNADRETITVKVGGNIAAQGAIGSITVALAS